MSLLDSWIIPKGQMSNNKKKNNFLNKTMQIHSL